MDTIKPNLPKSTFRLNGKVKVTFQSTTPIDHAVHLDDEKMVKKILLSVLEGKFDRSLGTRCVSLIERISGDQEKVIYTDPGASSSNDDMKNSTDSGIKPLSAGNSTGKVLKKNANERGRETITKWAMSSDDSSDDDSSDEMTKLKDPPEESDYIQKSTNRTWWTPEQEKFLIQRVDEFEHKVGIRKEFKTAKQMYEAVAELFNRKFKANRTGDQMLSKRKALVKAEEGKGRKNKRKAPPTKKLSAVEQAILLIETMSEKREKRREEREAMRKQESREREERIVSLLTAAIERKENDPPGKDKDIFKQKKFDE